MENQPLTVLPLITLRDMVLFPHTVRPFIVGRPQSIAAVEMALQGDRKVFLSLQQDPQAEDPSTAELMQFGVVANIVQSLPLPNGHYKLLVESLERARVCDFLMDGSAPHVSVHAINEEKVTGQEIDGLVLQVSRIFDQYTRKQQGFQGGVATMSLNPEEPNQFIDQVASYLPIKTELKQKILETVNLLDRIKFVKRVLLAEIDQVNLDHRLNKEVEKQIEKAQREYYLNEKMKLIKKELGREDTQGELEDLKDRIEKMEMPEVVKEKALAEIHRLEFMPPVSAEATVSRSYIDWLMAMPWAKTSKDKKDIRRSRKILDEDHFGLEKVKERILEFLSVRRLTRSNKGSILCFVGPPGTGKTSIARSIARSMGREFVRLSLGGVRDEAEIRGHRRTYIGAFPGQIIQLVKRAGTKNPVFLLDEVDKLGADFRGDPTSALLEVLDPEQNNSFLDHYIDVPFDMSEVFFITTANVTHSIPPALLDRMEMVPFSGYTLPEKISIAEGYLIQKQLKENGLKEKDVTFGKEGLPFLIHGYTREAGGRSLEREIAAVYRKIAHRVVQSRKRTRVVLTPEKVEELLGVPRFKDRKILHEDEIGVTVGLAWTERGGDILLIESNLMPGKGNLILTGQMGDVMQESARAALSFLRSHARQFGLMEDFYREKDVHIHIPEGAIPKDGPSAGISMGSSLASALTGIPVRHDIAMTGEVTLRGKVLPIGGLKEKILAAKQHEIFHVLLPLENEKDLSDISEVLKKGMTFHFVDNLLDVLKLALREDPVRKVATLPTDPVESVRPETSR